MSRTSHRTEEVSTGELLGRLKVILDDMEAQPHVHVLAKIVGALAVRVERLEFAQKNPGSIRIS